MNFPHNLTTRLDTLTQALDGSGDDLTSILAVLAQDLTAAVASFTGLSITVLGADQPVTVMALTSHTAAASILLPLTGSSRSGPAGHLVLYAGDPGAFTDLAADARAALGLHGQIVVDGHLPPPSASAMQRNIQAMQDRSTIEQAIGFLLEQGHLPAGARAELHRLAAANHVSPAEIAQTVIQGRHWPNLEIEDEQAG